MQLSKKDGLTLRDSSKLSAEGILLPHIVGTPIQIADQLEEIAAARLRKEYTGTALRENLGLGKASLAPAVRSPEPAGIH